MLFIYGCMRSYPPTPPNTLCCTPMHALLLRMMVRCVLVVPTRTPAGAQLDALCGREQQLFVELAAADPTCHGNGWAQAAATLYQHDQRWGAAVQEALWTSGVACLQWLAAVLAVVCIAGYVRGAVPHARGRCYRS